MKRLLSALELDLAVEKAGRKMELRGKGGEYVARFPTLRSLVYFGWHLRKLRSQIPSSINLSLAWRSFRYRL